MVSFIIWIVVIFIIYQKVTGKGIRKDGQKRETPVANQPRKERYTMQEDLFGSHNPLGSRNTSGAYSSSRSAQASGKRTLTAQERERLNNYRASKLASTSGINTASRPAAGSTTSSSTAARNVSGSALAAMRQERYSQSTTKAVAEKARQKQRADIVQMAKGNNERLKEDVTLEEIEQEHGHSETMEKEMTEHSRHCQTLKNDTHAELAVESYLGSTEDLITMGYSGTIQNQRDFLGEAQDMLEAISMPNSAVPDMVNELPVQNDGKKRA